MTASNALLTELGLPPRPTTTADLQSWEDQLVPSTKWAIDGSEEFCASPPPAAVTPAASSGRTASKIVPDVSNNHVPSTIWSGYEAQSGPYQKAVGHFQ
jgi:hypothetical protein